MNKLIASLLSALLICLPVLPATADEAATPQERPRIGLVLSGGGAKGGAHVGVLKVLEELRVPVDCISGTSMGALIGAGYAAGQPASALETFVNGIDWSTVVGGVGRRALRPVEQNRMATEAQSEIKLGLEDGRVVTGAGLIDTSGIDNLLMAYVAQARMVNVFDELPIPFRAVATDMVTGNMVVLKEGDLATAMRASMAIPGAFSPVRLNDMVLSDGGMVRNIPVDVARSMCAEVVIVVNLVESATSPDELVHATEVASRSMGIGIIANEAIQLATLGERDVLVNVPMGDITTADFERVPETIPLGEAAARAMADRLSQYSLPPAEYTAWRQEVNVAEEGERHVASIGFEGLNWVNQDYLRSVSDIHVGDTVSIDAISRDALRMAALDELESVAYRLEGDVDNTTLIWMPGEASIGKDYLSPSLGLYGDGEGDLKFQVGVQYVRRWVNDRGGQWRNTLEMGYESLISSSFYQPFDVGQEYFVEPELVASRSVENIFLDGDHVATARFKDLGGRVDLGWNVAHAAQLRFGYWGTHRTASVQTGPPDVSDVDAVDSGLAFVARYDTRNTPSFATKGMSAQLEYFRSDESLGADREWQRLEAAARKAISIGRNLVWVGLAGGTDPGDDLPVDRAFSLGGPRTLAGYQYDEVRVDSYWLADANFLWRLKDLVPLKQKAIYAGLGVYASGLYDRFDEVPDDEVYGGAVYLAGSTPLGPVSLGVAYATDNSSIWLSIGRSVGKGSILDDGLFK